MRDGTAPWKRIAALLVLPIVALQGMRIVLAARAQTRVAEIAAAANVGIAAQLAEDLAKRPNLRGAPRGESCRVLYEKVLCPMPFILEGRGQPKPFPPPGMDGAARAAVEACRPFVAVLREATRCDHFDTDIAFGPFPVMPKSGGVYPIGRLLVLEGQEHAAAGDAEGAVDRYADALRVAADLTMAPVIDEAVLLATVALHAAGELVSGPAHVGEPTLTRLERALALLEPAMPSQVARLRRAQLDRDRYVGLSRSLDGAWALPDRFDEWANVATVVVATERGAIVRAIETADAMQREVVKAADADEDTQRRVSERIASDVRAAHNSFVDSFAPRDVLTGLRAEALLRACFALVRQAIALERTRIVAGRYPDRVDAPPDPCMPGAALRYEVTGVGLGYRIWSAGLDGHNENGGGDDPRLERKPVP